MKVFERLSRLDGFLFRRSDWRFQDLRRLFNGLIQTQPVALFLPRTVVAAKEALRELWDTDTPFSIRAGGHNVAGTALVQDGIVVDCRLLRSISMEQEGRVFHVAPGVTWGEYDAVSSSHGTATPGGIISDTGVGGLTLGGGIGWLNGLHGLSCDSLIGADVLLADGSEVRATEDSHSDLLWALRGGGGNFGFVSEFTFAAYPLSSVYAGSGVYTAARANEALRRFFDVASAAPDELTLSLVASQVGGQPVVSIDMCFAGAQVDGVRVTDRLLPAKRGSLVADTRRQLPYVTWQREFDDPRRYGRRSYWKSIYIDCDFYDFEVIFCDLVNRLPNSFTMLTFDHVHGVASRVLESESAFAHRGKSFLFLINTNWESENEDAEMIEWTSEAFGRLEERWGSTSYLNYLSDEGDARIRSAFSDSVHRKLRLVKKKYDPENRFRGNQNISPSD